MMKKREGGVYVSYYVQKEVKEKLDKYCEDVGQTATTAIQRILLAHIDKHFKNKSENDEFIS